MGWQKPHLQSELEKNIAASPEKGSGRLDYARACAELAEMKLENRRFRVKLEAVASIEKRAQQAEREVSNLTEENQRLKNAQREIDAKCDSTTAKAHKRVIELVDEAQQLQVSFQDAENRYHNAVLTLKTLLEKGADPGRRKQALATADEIIAEAAERFCPLEAHHKGLKSASPPRRTFADSAREQIARNSPTEQRCGLDESLQWVDQDMEFLGSTPDEVEWMMQRNEELLRPEPVPWLSVGKPTSFEGCGYKPVVAPAGCGGWTQRAEPPKSTGRF